MTSTDDAPEAGDRYAEHAPSAALAEYVACLWTTVSAGEPRMPRRPHRVLPDGCMDIIVNLGDPWSAVDASSDPVRERAYVVGAMTRPVLIQRGGSVRFLGVRFRPGRAAAALRVAACDLTDAQIPLSDIWGDADVFVERIGEVASLAEQVAALDAALVKRLPRNAHRPSEVDVAVARILSTGGRIGIEFLSETMGRTRQHLARMFARHVGLSPKTLARVVRARAAVEGLRRTPMVQCSALALDLGYYDQAHLVTELKALTGLTPGGWSAERQAVPILQDFSPARSHLARHSHFPR
jgi:AraC-like DNA-binding protein